MPICDFRPVRFVCYGGLGLQTTRDPHEEVTPHVVSTRGVQEKAAQ